MAQEYAAGITGGAQRAVRDAARAFVEKDGERLFGFVRELLSECAECSLPVIVVSGAPDEPMQEYAAALGFSLAEMKRFP